MKEKFVTVTPESGNSYQVFVESGWQDYLISNINKMARGKLFLISQKGLEKHLLNDLTEFLQPLISNGKLEQEFLLIEPGEENKHLKHLGSIYNRLLELGVERNSMILAVGGGVVGDLVGFVAATIHRGVDFIQIPTTLLAAVDSSVGGKVAVNVDFGKNMVGSFHQPSMVYFNLNLLSTLPQREWICGLAELIKHSFLEQSGELIEMLSGKSKEFYSTGNPLLGRAVRHSIAIKSGVVGQDEKEEGLRAILNLGHTTAHAIESVTNYSQFSHGEAVSRGLVTALILSRQIAGLPVAEEDRMIELMQEYDLPLDTAGLSAERLYADMKYDKKSIGGKPRFVLLNKTGVPQRNFEVSISEFSLAWEEQKRRFN